MRDMRVPDAPGQAAVWRRSRSIAAVESPQRAVVVDLDHLEAPARILVGAGASIWGLINGERPVADIVEAIAAEAKVDRDEAMVGVLAFLRELHSSGLIIEARTPRETD